jgi:hypothetical protein
LRYPSVLDVSSANAESFYKQLKYANTGQLYAHINGHTGDDDVPGDVLKLLGEGGLKTSTKLMNAIYDTREWPKDFTEVTMIALKKKTKATKCSDHRTYSKDNSKDTEKKN